MVVAGCCQSLAVTWHAVYAGLLSMQEYCLHTVLTHKQSLEDPQVTITMLQLCTYLWALKLHCPYKQPSCKESSYWCCWYGWYFWSLASSVHAKCSELFLGSRDLNVSIVWPWLLCYNWRGQLLCFWPWSTTTAGILKKRHAFILASMLHALENATATLPMIFRCSDLVTSAACT